MSANQPTSFRFPFKLPSDIHPQVAAAIRYSFSSLKDLNDAIESLNTEVKANTTAVTTVAQTVSTPSSGGSTAPVIGRVNLQPNLTPGAYTTVQADFGGLIVVQSAIPFAYTLNSALMPPFFVTVYNLGTGLVTATPSTGLVNNLGSVTLATNQFGIFYFDGTNWWDVFPLITVPLSGTSASLGGSPMTVGQTISVTVSTVGALSTMAVVVSPQTYPGDGFVWDGYVSAADTSTVRLTCVSAGTPVAALYNVRVIQ